jgi:hypothetical protein
MKRYAVLVTADYGWAIHSECDTIMEAVLKREEAIGYCTPLIVEIIPPIEAYAMANCEAEDARVKALQALQEGGREGKEARHGEC